MFYLWIKWQTEATPFSKYLVGGMNDVTTELLLTKPKKEIAKQ